jgi:hypothetical protein
MLCLGFVAGAHRARRGTIALEGIFHDLADPEREAATGPLGIADTAAVGVAHDFESLGAPVRMSDEEALALGPELPEPHDRVAAAAQCPLKAPQHLPFEARLGRR